MKPNLIHLYYAYYDDDEQLYYYYDTETEKTSWIYPKDGLVKDPETFKTFANPDILFPSIKSSISSKILKPNEDSNQEIPLVVDLDENLIKFIDQSSSQNIIPLRNQNEEPNKVPFEGKDKESNPIEKKGSTSEEESQSDEKDYSIEEEESLNDETSQNEERVQNEEVHEEEQAQNEEQTTNEEITQSEEQTTNEEITQSEEQTTNEEITQNEEQTQSEEKTTNEEITQNEEQTTNEEQTQSEEKTTNEEQTTNEEITQSEEKTTNEEITQSEEKTTNEEQTENEEQTQSEEQIANEEQTTNEEQTQSEEKTQSEEQGQSPQKLNHFRYIPTENDEPHFLPRTVSDEIHNYQAASFAKRHFQKTVNGKICRRTSITMEDLVLFSKTPLSSSLLADLADNTKKDALKCFKLILQATGVTSSFASSKVATVQTINDSSTGNSENAVYFSSTQAVDKIISMLYDDSALIDEVFFQLMKQTNQCPKIEWLIQTWNLFLVIASIFPSTKDSELWIKSFLMKGIADKDTQIGTLVQFILIRFNIRCSIGFPIDKKELLIEQTQSNEKGKRIKKKTNANVYNFISLFNCTSTFKVSLYEIMWSQRISYPNCPIPIFLHRITKSIIEKGAFNTEGIFRLPGNMKEVQRLANENALTDEDLNNAKLNDLASLLKMWIRDLSEPIIPFQYSGPDLFNAFLQGRIIEYVSSMPRLHSLTLAYLIGFLQEMALHEDKTKMSSSNLAIVFAPNIIREKENPSSLENMNFALISLMASQKENASLSNELIERLIIEWDVSSIYPLDDEVFQHA